MSGGADKTVSPRDLMFNPQYPDNYFRIGEASCRAVQTGLGLAGVEPQRVLDLPCGHGRGLRWLVSALDAEVVTCDIDRDAVDFCAQEFGAVPCYSHREPEQIPLQGTFDLITCGSLFTHLDAPMWTRFLSVFRDHLSPKGMLAFSTGGRYFLPDIRTVLMRHLGEADEFLTRYEETGFAYGDYLAYTGYPSGYGLARAKPSWVMPLLAALDLEVVYMGEGGWDTFQDVWCVGHADTSFT